MKIRLICLCMLHLFITRGMAQESKTVYFNGRGNPCTKDSAWVIKVATKENGRWHVFEYAPRSTQPTTEGYYSDDGITVREGEFIIYNDYAQKKIEGRGLYKNNEREGQWDMLYTDNAKKSSSFYVKGNIRGTSLSWHQNGGIMDSTVINENGDGYSKGFFKEGGPEHYGTYVADKKNGDWTYYHRNGKPSSIEKMKDGSTVSATCYDEKGNPQPTCEAEVESEFPGGASAWIHYLTVKMNRASYPKEFFDGKIYGQVVLQFIVDSTGKVIDVEVIQSLDPRFDKIALDVIKNSPKWIPAIQHGRYVKSYKKQPLTFPRYSGK